MADQTPPAPADRPRPRGAAVRTALVGAALVVGVLVAAVALTGGGDGAPDTTAASPGATAPAFGLTDAVEQLPEAEVETFDGEGTVAMASFLGGQPVVLNFWATWCAPCVAEMPELQQLHEAGAGAFRLVGVNTQDAALNAVPFAEDLGITYDLVADRDGSYFTATGSFGMPTTLFVDPDGSVVHRHTGVLTLEQARDLIDEHLGVAVPL